MKALILALGFAASGALADSISIVPANPTPVDLVRLRYEHVGCVTTNADSLRVSQQSNRITAGVDLQFPPCASVLIVSLVEEFTLGRLPSGDYDAELVVNPPPSTLGPSLLLGPVHFTVLSMPATGSLLPHEDYSDLWWSPGESGWALLVKQSGDKLFAVWVVYDASGRPTWYSLQPGNWRRDSEGRLRYTGTVYRTTGPYWGTAFNSSAVTVAAVGTADFVPSGSSRAQFIYTIEGVSGSKSVERMRF